MISCIQKIRGAVVNDMYYWSKQRKDNTYYSLSRGREILSSQDQLDCYLMAYGNMHEAKLLHAFRKIDDLDRHEQRSIQVIDYGCGQGLGTIVFNSYFKWMMKSAPIKKVTLIEPSRVALNQASKYVKSCLTGVDQDLICKKLNNINVADLKAECGSIKFHIFSNILDIDDFDIDILFEKINKSLTGENYFICVSPDCWDAKRLDQFIGRFKENGCMVISEHKDRLENCSNPEKPWSVYGKVFKVKI